MSRSVSELRSLMVLEDVLLENVLTGSVKIRELHEDSPGFQSMVLSIAKDGVWHHTLGRPAGEGDSPLRELVDGGHRFEASKLAKLATLPMGVIPDLTDDEARILQATLNIACVPQDKNELRNHIKVFMSQSQNQLMSKKDIARAFSLTAQALSNILSLNKLVPAAAEALDLEKMSFSHGLLLSRVDPEIQVKMMNHIALPIAEFGDFLKEAVKEFKTGIKPAEGPKPRPRSKDDLVECMDKLNYQEETHKQKGSEDYSIIVANLLQIKWVLSLDAETLAKRDEKKSATKQSNLNKQAEATMKKLREMEAKLEALRSEEASLSIA